MENINYPAQIVMFIAFAVMIGSFWCKKRENILKLQFIANTLFAVQYLLLSAYTATALSVISIVRAFVFAKKNECKNDEKKSNQIIKWNSMWILITFVLAYIISSLVSWDGVVSSMALAATLVYTFAMWADKPQYIRVGSNIASIFWITHNYMVGGYIGCVTETILFVSNTVAIITNIVKDRRKNVNYEVEIEKK